jgi:hypothetical protein
MPTAPRQIAFRLPSPAWYALLFCACLFLGGWAGVSVARSNVARQIFHLRRPASGLAQPANGQRNLLVIGVDRLDNAQPRLESVWLALYFPGRSPVAFLPLYPGPGGEEALPAAFELTPAGDPGERFLEQLRREQLWWSGIVLLDEAGLAAALDFLGGLPVGERPLGGALALASLARPWEDPAGALQGQTALLQASCAAAAGRDFDPREIRQFLRDTSGHLRADFELSQAAEEWLDLAGEAPGLTCEFPLAPARSSSDPYP